MAQVKDPVCGMMIESSTAQWKAEHAGQTYFFCAAECERTFKADPEQYAGASARAAGGREAHEPPFTQSGGMTSPKFGAAGSGGAEYELMPESHDRR